MTTDSEYARAVDLLLPTRNDYERGLGFLHGDVTACIAGLVDAGATSVDS